MDREGNRRRQDSFIFCFPSSAFFFLINNQTSLSRTSLMPTKREKQMCRPKGSLFMYIYAYTTIQAKSVNIFYMYSLLSDRCIPAPIHAEEKQGNVYYLDQVYIFLYTIKKKKNVIDLTRSTADAQLYIREYIQALDLSSFLMIAIAYTQLVYRLYVLLYIQNAGRSILYIFLGRITIQTDGM